MIKEYFTDGLISLAILLSLFRTDLFSVNLNNLINYPEVQDIILGQTAAYLPANFHSIQQSGYSPSLKHIELDNDALSSWYQNVNNIFRFRQGRQNEIETFLVSGSQVVSESFPDSHSSPEIPGNENITQDSFNLLEQNAQDENSTDANHGNATSSDDSVSNHQETDYDSTSLYNLFPGCNLTREDVALIDTLWKQDVDLGVGREVFDLSLRQELEREREVEQLKQKEKKKAETAAREREERAKQEQAGRWLKQNFMRDGETGEWVKLQNNSTERSNDTSLVKREEFSNDSLTLDAALDYMSSGLDPDLFNFDNSDGQSVTTFENFSSYDLNQSTDYQNAQVQPEQQTHIFHTQNSLEESLNGLVDYLNNTSDSNELAIGGLIHEIPEYKHDLPSTADLGLQSQVDHSAVLFQNATMPTPGLEIGTDFGLHPTSSGLNVSAVSQNSSLNGPVDLGLDGLDFFNDLPNLPEGSVDDLDFPEVDFLLDMDNSSDIIEGTIGTAYNPMSLMTDNLSDSSIVADASPNLDLSDNFAGLEGATGGSDFTAGDYDGPYNKLSRLSESSSDSGIAHHEFSSSSSSYSSSYAGSPAGSQHGNSSTASNDTEHDPHKMGAMAHHVAHNHTYNTLPGQIPREVKKYALKEPSKKGPHSRDQKRATELKVPFSVEEIIESPVDTFNEMLTKHKLSESQLNLIRDIRRRGKNKVAAQNCRKRKVHVIVSLSDELEDLETARDRLKAERAEIEKERLKMKDRFSYLYSHIFQSLRDDRGEPYDPNMYSLQQSSDGNVFLVPRNVTNNHTSGADDKGSRKRKSSDN